jgi:hypothetical protein
MMVVFIIFRLRLRTDDRGNLIETHEQRGDFRQF